MPAAEDRQAKALEDIARSMRTMSGALTALNENVVYFGKMIKEATNDESNYPNQSTLDDETARILAERTSD